MRRKTGNESIYVIYPSNSDVRDIENLKKKKQQKSRFHSGVQLSETREEEYRRIIIYPVNTYSSLRLLIKNFK